MNKFTDTCVAAVFVLYIDSYQVQFLEFISDLDTIS